MSVLSQLLMPVRNKHVVSQTRSRRFKPRLETLENRVVPASVIWDGGGDGLYWHDPLNWDGDQLPGVGDDVAIIAPHVIHDGGSTSINSLYSDAELDFTGNLFLATDSAMLGRFDVSGSLDLAENASLDLYGGGSVDGTAALASNANLYFHSFVYDLADGTLLSGPGWAHVVNAAQLTANGQVQANNLQVGQAGTTAGGGGLTINGTLINEGTMQGTGTVTVNNTFNWTAGTMTGTGTTLISATGTMNVSHSANLEQNARTLDNRGTINWTGAQGAFNWFLRNNARIENWGTFNLSEGANRTVWLRGDQTGTLAN